MTPWEIIIVIGKGIAGLGIPAVALKLYKKAKADRTKHRQDLMFEVLKIKSQLYPNGGESLFDHVISLKFAQKNTWEVLEMAVWESDINGRITYVTTALCRMVGRTPVELLHNSWLGKIIQDQREEVEEEWQDSLRTGSMFSMYFIFIRADGMHQKVHAIAIHNKNKSGEVISSLGRISKEGEPYNPNKIKH